MQMYTFFQAEVIAESTLLSKHEYGMSDGGEKWDAGGLHDNGL
jgi:hypothetical protein